MFLGYSLGPNPFFKAIKVNILYSAPTFTRGEEWVIISSIVDPAKPTEWEFFV